MSTLVLRNLRTTHCSHRLQSKTPFPLLGTQCLYPAITSQFLRYASTKHHKSSKPSINKPSSPSKASHPAKYSPTSKPSSPSKASPPNRTSLPSKPSPPAKPSPIAPPRQSSTTSSTSPENTSELSKPAELSTPSTPSTTLSTVNGPVSTLPAPINAPIRAPDQPLPLYLFALGKSYVTFYKTGVKNVWANYKLSRTLQSTIRTQHQGSIFSAIAANSLTRSDFQLLTRSWHDVKRVPLFALVLLVCGEFTPFVVLALTGIVPFTCRIPKQINRTRTTLEARRKISFRNLTLPPPDQGGVEGLQRMQLLHISWSLGLSSKVWDWLGGQLPGLPTGILRRKVQVRVDYLKMDFRLIRKAGGVGEMSQEVVELAGVERGLNVVGRGEEMLREDLEKWLSATEVPMERLLLTRPGVWPSKGSNK